MKKKNLFIASALGLASLLPFTAAAQDASPENYLRSSIYTVLIQSNAQNKLLEEEAKTEGAGASLIKGFANTDAKRAANDDGTSIAEAPQKAFLELAIPDQFNDHNLTGRIINFDSLEAGLTQADKDEAAAMMPKKKGGGFGKMLGNVAKSSVGVSTDNPQAKFSDLAPAIVNKYLKTNHVADSLVAKWFDYGRTGDVWDFALIEERGLQNASEQEKAINALTGMTPDGFQLLNNTYVVAINLRFRSNQAIVAEAEAVAGGLLAAAGGSAGVLATTALSAGAAAAAGDGFSVQAVTYLYHLVWNDEVSIRMAEEIVGKKASFEDLVSSGLCKLEFVGTEKASARVRQSITSSTPQSVLTKRATERAIDAALAKLQEKYDVFRTAFPITGSDENGNVMAKVGMKEGIEKDDVYEILEKTINPKTGKVEWKSKGKVKAVDKKIWDNRAGAAEDVAMANAEAADEKSKETDYTSLGATTFSGKKGDYTGCYLRLSKKK